MLLRQAIKKCLASTPFIQDHIWSNTNFHRINAEEKTSDTYVLVVYGDSDINDRKNAELDFICFPVTLELHVKDCDKEFWNFLARKIAKSLHQLHRKEFRNDLGEDVVRNGVFTYANIESPVYDDDTCRFIYSINFDAQEDFCCDGQEEQFCKEHSKE